MGAKPGGRNKSAIVSPSGLSFFATANRWLTPPAGAVLASGLPVGKNAKVMRANPRPKSPPPFWSVSNRSVTTLALAYHPGTYEPRLTSLQAGAEPEEKAGEEAVDPVDGADADVEGEEEGKHKEHKVPIWVTVLFGLILVLSLIHI